MNRTVLAMMVLLLAVPAMAQDSGWIGVTVADQKEGGALVRSVELNSPAAKAGLKENDIVVQFNKQDVIGAVQLTRLVRETPVGRTVDIKVRRDNREQTFQVTTEAYRSSFSGVRVFTPDYRAFQGRIMDAFDNLPRGVIVETTWSLSGIRVTQLTDQLRTFFGVAGNDGVLVTAVDAGSDAEKAGLKAGDVIISVDGEGVSTPSEFSREIRQAGNSITMRIVRDKKEQEIRFERGVSR